MQKFEVEKKVFEEERARSLMRLRKIEQRERQLVDKIDDLTRQLQEERAAHEETKTALQVAQDSFSSLTTQLESTSASPAAAVDPPQKPKPAAPAASGISFDFGFGSDEPEPEPVTQAEPEAPVESKPAGKKFRALYDFAAQQEGDLGFKKGDTIIVTNSSGAWWEGSLNGQSGTFPNNYVTPC